MIMKNIPKRIWLHAENNSFKEHRVSENDIAYINEESVHKAFIDIAKYLEDAIYRGINPTRIEERFTELLNK